MGSRPLEDYTMTNISFLIGNKKCLIELTLGYCGIQFFTVISHWRLPNLRPTLHLIDPTFIRLAVEQVAEY